MERLCRNCFDFVNPARWSLGYTLCLKCGEKFAKGEPLPQPEKIPLTQKELMEEVKRNNELRKIAAEQKKRVAEKYAKKEADAKIKWKKKESARLKKKYGEV
jgi:predicted Zn-dependent protease